MTLTEFLLARLSEDEQTSRRALGATLTIDDGSVLNVDMWYEADWAEIDGPQLRHVDRWHPTRVLAECEAKRLIIELHGYESCGCYSRSVYPCPTLRALAVPYADHPDFEEEWRP